jgi:hypothetical protein
MPETLGADHWRKRAEEARAIADQMMDAMARRAMMRIATDYDKIADRAEARAMGKPPGENSK